MPHELELQLLQKFESYKEKHALDRLDEVGSGEDDSCFIHDSSIVEAGAVIGSGSKVWHFCHISPSAVIGKNCSFGQNIYIGTNVRVGNGCKLQNNVSLYEGVTLEDYVFCGPSCVFTNDLTPRAKYPKGRAAYKPTLVREGASIGANATIICGNTIGRWALIASGAVVTSDVPDHALMLGIPARRSGWVCECGNVLRGGLACDSCGRHYHEEASGLVEDTQD
ncbi:MAG: N-acetyltransferase [Clostridia bacterium]|nr:N-acetyltransferase [Clostridia bacterium]